MKLNIHIVKPAFAAVLCAGLLASCATPYSEAVFKFPVLRCKDPVAVTNWQFDPAQAGNPDGQALNIVTAMTHGDVDEWLATWPAEEKPVLTPEDRAKLLQQWASIKDGHESILGRIVAGGDLVIEISVTNAQAQEEKVLCPLQRINGTWYQTKMDADSEYLHWENSPNKSVQPMSGVALQNYIAGVQSAHGHN